MTLTNSKIQRRQFLRTALATAGGVAALPAFGALGSLASHGRVYAAPGKGGYGPLVPTADLRDGGIRMALPEGFKYRSFSVAGEMFETLAPEEFASWLATYTPRLHAGLPAPVVQAA